MRLDCEIADRDAGAGIIAALREDVDSERCTYPRRRRHCRDRNGNRARAVLRALRLLMDREAGVDDRVRRALDL